MRAEALLLGQGQEQGLDGWWELLTPKLRSQTLVGVSVMFFQRVSLSRLLPRC